MKKIDVTIKGIKPLLQDRPPDEKKNAYSRRKTSKRIQSDVNDKLYKNAKDEIVQPAEHLFQAMIKCGARLKAKGVKYMTYKKLIQAYVVVEPELILHKNQDWVTDRRSAVIPATKGRIMVERPRLNDWELDFTLTIIDEDYINIDDLQNILIEAGMTNGLGAYRPRFGLFEVTKWQPLE